MRKVVFSMSMSVDGFFEGPDREIDWHLIDEELHQHFNDELRPMGMFLDGRVTHQLMAEFWPTADADPGAAPEVAEFARIWREMPKWLYSRTITHADWNTTVKTEVDPEEIRALKAQPGGDLAVGGPDLARTFRAHDLIDEYRVYVHPVLLGQGRPLFPELDLRADLRLTATRTFRSGVTLLQYAR